MNFAILTGVTGFLKPFAWVFGLIFNGIYNFLALFGVENIAVCLVIFTIIVKMLMMPLTIRQQKFSKLSAKMQPELSAIQAKYKGKKDEQSQRYMQMETQEVYQKYGTNPASGCLPMLITLPIIFAMYRVIYTIPAYVTKLRGYYTVVANAIMKNDGYFNYMIETGKSLNVPSINKFSESDSNNLNHMIDILTKFGTDNYNELVDKFSLGGDVTDAIDKINHAFSVGSMNILDAPSHYGILSIAIIVPILAVVTQLGSSFLSKAQNKSMNQSTADNPMAQSMNSMLFIMPFMSGFFAYTFPLCIGIYWVINTVVSVIQQIGINLYIDKKLDLDKMIEKNRAKQKKRLEKHGLSEGSVMAEMAKRQTKSINYSQAPTQKKTTSNYANLSSGKNTKSSTDSTDIKNSTSNDTSGKKSISGYANLLRKD